MHPAEWRRSARAGEGPRRGGPGDLFAIDPEVIRPLVRLYVRRVCGEAAVNPEGCGSIPRRSDQDARRPRGHDHVGGRLGWRSGRRCSDREGHRRRGGDARPRVRAPGGGLLRGGRERAFAVRQMRDVAMLTTAASSCPRGLPKGHGWPWSSPGPNRRNPLESPRAR